MAKRRYKASGTIATTTDETIAIPANVKINWILIYQATPNFAIFFDDGSGPKVYTNANPDTSVSDNYGFNLECMTDVNINNFHATNAVVYDIYGEEDI
jgi:hypothetical protein